MLLTNKVTLVTGANRGIGKCVVETFARNGANVFACVRALQPETVGWMRALEDECGIFVKPILLDLSDEVSVKGVVREVMTVTRSLDVLVNNAGVASGSLFQMTTIAELRNLFEINFFGQIQLSQSLARLMVRNKSGSIINLVSTAAYIADPGTMAYGASKAAFARATQSMATELGASNIRVNAIAPSVTRTDMYDQMSVEARDKLINSSALKRAAEPQDIANSALFLASDLSSFITGQIVRVDGGIF